MWLSSHLFQVIIVGWLITTSNAHKHDPGDKYPTPGRPWAQITERHNTCGQVLAGDYSGYIAISTLKEQANIFFWFFEARHKPQDAPVILFLNGGPGISSIYRVFDGSGPCNFGWKGDIGPNPHSLNEYAHILYVDQPVGAGFSFGNATFTDNQNAADYLYQFVQHFYFEFSQYRENEFGIWTSDWGSTAGLALAERILDENVGLIRRRTGLNGEIPIKLSMMGLESPKIDPPLQLGYMYMYMVKNKHLHVQSFEDAEKGLLEYMDTLEANLEACAERKKEDCKDELKGYRRAIRSLTTPDGLRTEFDLWDVRDARHNTDRSRNIGMKLTPAARWLNDAKTQAHLGVTGGKLAREPIKFEPWNIKVLKPFSANQEIIRSWRKNLRNVVHSGIRTMIVGGDADLVTNHLGLRKLSQNVTVGIDRKFELEPLVWPRSSFNPKRPDRMLHVGEFKTVEHFTFVNVKNAGHVIAERKPKTLVKLFWSLVKGKSVKIPFVPYRKDKEVIE